MMPSLFFYPCRWWMQVAPNKARQDYIIILYTWRKYNNDYNVALCILLIIDLDKLIKKKPTNL